MDQVLTTEARRPHGQWTSTAVLLLALLFTGPLIGSMLVLLWASWCGTPLRELGLLRPRSWPRVIAGGLLLGVVFKLLMKAVVMPLLGTPPINPRYHYLAGDAAASIGLAILAIASAGFGEELVFRGFLFARLRKLFGARPFANAAIVLITALLFGAAHLQGGSTADVRQATIVGLVFGSIYAFTGALPLLMIAHAAFDVTAIIIIYLKLEVAVATFIFRP